MLNNIRHIIWLAIHNWPTSVLHYCAEKYYSLFPITDAIVFCNRSGAGFGDDPKYIAVKLLDKKCKSTLFWLVKDTTVILPDGIIPVKISSVKAIKILCTSRIWIFNCKPYIRVKKRQSQFYLQTWHGTLGIKKVEQDVEDTLPLDYIENSKAHSAMTDLMYSNNDFLKWKFENRYWYHGPVLKCDVPRESIIINTPPELIVKVRQFFGISKNTKIVLYAPTFRMDFKTDVYKWDYNKVLDALEHRFQNKFVMLVRLHPNIASKADFINYNDRILEATKYPDMQELLAASDVLINDYSASMFEFSLMYKPVFLFGPDWREYTATDRSFEFQLDELPYSLTDTIEELINEIKVFDMDKYKERVDTFYKKVGLEDHGNGDEVIANLILEKLYE